MLFFFSSLQLSDMINSHVRGTKQAEMPPACSVAQCDALSSFSTTTNSVESAKISHVERAADRVALASSCALWQQQQQLFDRILKDILSFFARTSQTIDVLVSVSGIMTWNCLKIDII